MKITPFNLYLRQICVTACLLVMGEALLPLSAYGQEIISKSESSRPVWLAVKTPRPGNKTFHYQITEGEHRNLEDAKRSCLVNLSTYIKQTNHIQTNTMSDIKVRNVDGEQNESESYDFVYQIEGEKLSITFNKIDEYWEYVLYPNGERVYRCHTLFAVAEAPGQAKFDALSFSRKYGARGFARSLIVPGWGQMYKGSIAKGACILGGEVLLVGGIIAAENLRSSYIKKMHENPKFMKTYNTKADNWENIRNVCIGGAAALYVYNLVDALVANGRKRTVVKKNQFAVLPTFTSDLNGVSLAFKF